LKRLGIVFVKNSRIAGPNFTNAAIRSPIPAPTPNAKSPKPLVKIAVKAPLLKNVLITELKVSMNPPAIEAALPSRSAVSPTTAVASPLLNRALKPLPIREPIPLKMFPSPPKTLPKIVACFAIPLKAGSPVLTIETKSLKNEPNFVVPENNPKKLLLKTPRTPSVLLITVKNSWIAETISLSGEIKIENVLLKTPPPALKSSKPLIALKIAPKNLPVIKLSTIVIGSLNLSKNPLASNPNRLPRMIIALSMILLKPSKNPTTPLNSVLKLLLKAWNKSIANCTNEDTEKLPRLKKSSNDLIKEPKMFNVAVKASVKLKKICGSCSIAPPTRTENSVPNTARTLETSVPAKLKALPNAIILVAAWLLEIWSKNELAILAISEKTLTGNELTIAAKIPAKSGRGIVIPLKSNRFATKSVMNEVSPKLIPAKSC